MTRRYLQTAFPLKDALNSSYKTEDGQALLLVGPIERINFFVGPNNCGKSRFLRSLAKRSLFSCIGSDHAEAFEGDFQALTKALPVLRSALANYSANVSFDGFGPIGVSAENVDQIESLLDQYFGSNEHENAKQRMQELVRALQFASGIREINRATFSNARGAIGQEGKPAIESLAHFQSTWMALTRVPREVPARHIYLPVFRSTLRIDDADGSDRFRDLVRQKYDLGPEQLDDRLQVFTGQLLYEKVLHARNGTRAHRDRVDAFEKFIGKAFFGGTAVNLVAALSGTHKGEVLLQIEPEDERPLYNLGDGIQALLLLLYPIFMADEETWIFAEEPELNLHPGLQRLFLETLLNNRDLAAKSLRFFFTTHSNNFLDYSIELKDQVAVLAFNRTGTRQGGFAVRSVLSPDRDVLHSLGVRNGSVLLANCTIWVEGPTDRQYVTAFLTAYQSDQQIKFKEDRHYSFIEYGGSLLANYRFAEGDTAEEASKDQIRAQFVANHVFLLSDCDEGKDDRHAKFRAMADETIHFEYFVTGGREIENLLSEQELRLAAPTWLQGTGQDLSQISRRAYRNRGLGAYLRKHIGKNAPDLSDKSGTLKPYYKKRLAQIVVQHIESSSMTKDAKALAKAVYDFIELHNRGSASSIDSGVA